MEVTEEPMEEEESWGEINMKLFAILVGDYSRKAAQHFLHMTEAEWLKWEPRYQTLITCHNNRPVPGVDKPLQPLEWWEQEFYNAWLLSMCVANVERFPQSKN
jgi:hypothetical protein